MSSSPPLLPRLIDGFARNAHHHRRRRRRLLPCLQVHLSCLPRAALNFVDQGS